MALSAFTFPDETDNWADPDIRDPRYIECLVECLKARSGESGYGCAITMPPISENPSQYIKNFFSAFDIALQTIIPRFYNLDAGMPELSTVPEAIEIDLNPKAPRYKNAAEEWVYSGHFSFENYLYIIWPLGAHAMWWDGTNYDYPDTYPIYSITLTWTNPVAWTVETISNASGFTGLEWTTITYPASFSCEYQKMWIHSRYEILRRLRWFGFTATGQSIEITAANRSWKRRLGYDYIVSGLMTQKTNPAPNDWLWFFPAIVDFGYDHALSTTYNYSGGYDSGQDNNFDGCTDCHGFRWLRTDQYDPNVCVTWGPIERDYYYYAMFDENGNYIGGYFNYNDAVFDDVRDNPMVSVGEWTYSYYAYYTNRYFEYTIYTPLVGASYLLVQTCLEYAVIPGVPSPWQSAINELCEGTGFRDGNCVVSCSKSVEQVRMWWSWWQYAAVYPCKFEYYRGSAEASEATADYNMTVALGTTTYEIPYTITYATGMYFDTETHDIECEATEVEMTTGTPATITMGSSEIPPLVLFDPANIPAVWDDPEADKQTTTYGYATCSASYSMTYSYVIKMPITSFNPPLIGVTYFNDRFIED